MWKFARSKSMREPEHKSASSPLLPSSWGSMAHPSSRLFGDPQLTPPAIWQNSTWTKPRFLISLSTWTVSTGWDYQTASQIGATVNAWLLDLCPHAASNPRILPCSSLSPHLSHSTNPQTSGPLHPLTQSYWNEALWWEGHRFLPPALHMSMRF
jgi:hypothetical protein